MGTCARKVSMILSKKMSKRYLECQKCITDQKQKNVGKVSEVSELLGLAISARKILAVNCSKDGTTWERVQERCQ